MKAFRIEERITDQTFVDLRENGKKGWPIEPPESRIHSVGCKDQDPFAIKGERDSVTGFLVLAASLLFGKVLTKRQASNDIILPSLQKEHGRAIRYWPAPHRAFRAV